MVDVLKPGPEMDCEVGRVMCELSERWIDSCHFGGPAIHTGSDDPPSWCGYRRARPSTDPGDALAALEATGLSYEIEVQKGEGSTDAYFVRIGAGRYSAMRQHDRHGYTLPEAVCLTILAWAKAKPHLPASSRMRLRAGKDGHA